jgi:hypothetical protein
METYAIPLWFRDIYDTVAEEYDIDVPPIFLQDGKLVPPSQLAIRMPDVLVEVMFSLRHYLIAENKKGSNSCNNFRGSGKGESSNTFTATIEQIRILKSSITAKGSTRKVMKNIVTSGEHTRKKRAREDDEEEQGFSKRSSDSV